jgi:hypothetical protein
MKIKQDFGIGAPGVEFYPYWGDRHPVTVEGSECYAVAWRNGKGYLLCVANLSLKDQKLTVRLDEKIFSGKAAITDAETKKSSALENSAFSVAVPRRNYRLYLIEGK